MANIGIRDGVISSSAQVEIQVPELRIKGDLIAENYIVSSSVSNIEYQSLSGSTIFGDSADDTHQFTGSISATGSLTVNGGGGGHPLTLQTDTGDKGISLLNYQGTEIFQLRQEAGDAGLVYLKDGGNIKLLFTARPDNHSYINVSGGNFGLGTASPAYKLQVSQAESAASDFQTNLDLARTWDAGSSTDRYHGLIFSDSNSVNAGIFVNRLASHANYNSDLHFYTNSGSSNMTPATALSTSKMMITAAGLVGIGTVSPGATLHIVSNSDSSEDFLIIEDTDTTAGSQIPQIEWRGNTATFGFFRYTKDGAFFRSAAESNLMHVSGSGQVGIGTTSPEAKLHIQQASSDYALHLDMPTNTTNHSNGLFIAGVDENTTSYPLFIKTNSSTLDEGAGNVRFVVRADGNIGIGTSSPAAKLEIQGANGTVSGTPETDADELVIRNNSDAGINILAGEGSGDTSGIVFGSTSDINGANIHYNYNDKLFRIGTQHASGILTLRSGNGAEAIRILANGNVGIGNSSPTKALSVTGEISSSGDINTAGQFEAGSAYTTSDRTLADFHGTRGKIKSKDNVVYLTTAAGGNRLEITDVANGNSAKGNILLQVSGQDADDKHLHLIPITDGVVTFSGANAKISGSATSTGSFGMLSLNNGGAQIAGGYTLNVKGHMTGSSLSVGDGVTLRDGALSIYNGGANVIQLRHDSGGELIFRNGNNAKNQLVLTDTKISGSSISTGSFGAFEIPGNFKVDSASQIFASTGAGSNNTIFGRNAATSFGANNGTNIIVGPNAADAMDGGESHNIAIGNHSMGDADEGASGTIDFNVAIGNSTLGGGAFSGTDQLYGNIAIGYQALTSTGTNGSTGQIGIGFQALEKVTTGTGNFAVGYNAGKLLTTGQYNLAIGHEALTNATELDDNLAIGYRALKVASGSAGKGRNMAIGYLAGKAVTSGEFNVLIGRSAGDQQTTANANTYMGYFAGYNTRSGSENVFIGRQAGYEFRNANSPYNVYVGSFAGYHNQTGRYNTYLGGSAGYGASGQSHSGNTGVGYNALVAVTTGGSNSTLGFGSGDALTTGHNNVAVGIGAIGVSTNVGYAVALGDTALGAGNATDAADGTVAIGQSALRVLTSGGANVAIGKESGKVLTTGAHNTFLGTTTGDDMVEGSYNIAIGSDALGGAKDGTADASQFNIFIGVNSGNGAWDTAVSQYNVGVGSYTLDGAMNGAVNNTAVGHKGLSAITTGDSNVAVGYQSGLALTTGHSNVIIGENAGSTATTQITNSVMVGNDAGQTAISANHVFIGDHAGYSAVANHGQVFIGYYAGAVITSGERNTAIGYQALDSADDCDDSIAIGYQALAGTDANANNKNIAIGNYAMDANLTGATNNVAVGHLALSAITSGDANVSLGSEAGESIDTGLYNVSVGYQSNEAITSGQYNITIGAFALETATTALKNIMIGGGAGQNITAGVAVNGAIGIGYGAFGGTGTQTTDINHTIAIGTSTLANLESGIGNVAVGYEALNAEDDGDHNTAIGYTALKAQTGTTGIIGNTAVGYEAGVKITTGKNNTVLGSQALSNETDGDYNVAIGWKAARNMTGATDNVVIGYKAMANIDNNPGDEIANCVAIGYEAFLGSDNNSTGTTTDANGTIAIGHSSLKVLTSGIGNVAIGFEALKAEDDGDKSTAIGYQTLTDQTGTTGTVGNTAIGYQAGQSVLTGIRNTYVGTSAGNKGSGSAADDNTAIGFRSLRVNTSGSRNTSLGAYSVQQMVNARDTVAIGYYTLANALTSTDIDGSVAIGSFSQAENRTGIGNTSVGFQSLKSDVNGDHNTAVGYQALKVQTGTSGTVGNTAVGYKALDEILTGTANVAVGANALGNADGAENENVGIGYNAGINLDNGSNNIAIGSNTNFSTAAASNQVVIGKDATGVANNSVTLGNADVTDIYMAQDSGAEVHAGSLVTSGNISGSATSTGSFGALHTAGRVGIGTTSQNSNLTIQTTAGSVDVAAATGTLQFGSVSSTLTPSIIGRQTAGTHGLFLMAMGLDGTTTGDMIFNTRENNNSTFATTANAGFKFQHFSTDLVTILRNGKVGIGVADPDSMLEVVGGAGATSINAHGVVKFRTTSNDSSELRHQFNMGGASDPGSYSIYQGDASTIGVNLAAGDVSYFNGGNVGIGTSSPSVALEVAGTISGSLINSSGDVVAFNASDERLKDNIKIIKEPIEKIKQLRGVEYQWNEKQNTYPTGSLDSGIIAQDVQKVLPQLVKERGDGYLGVRQERLVGLLVESIKDQQDQIDDLRKQIKEMKDGSS